MSTTPKVSIVMPTYNRGNIILESIASVRRQTYPNWELLIVDDGSDDDTQEIIDRLQDKRIQFHEAGRIGINGRIKNIGIGMASGELIAFIDSDDLWADDKLEKQLSALRQYPSAGFSLTGGYNFRDPGHPIDYFYKQREGIRYDNVFISFFKSQLSATTPSLVLWRKCLATTGFFNESRPFSDVDFILTLARHFSAVVLFEPLLYRRLHNDNDSQANWIKGYNHGIEMIHAYKNDLPPNVIREALFRLYVNFGEDCLSHNQKGMAIKNFIRAWRNKPLSIIPFKKTGKAVLS